MKRQELLKKLSERTTFELVTPSTDSETLETCRTCARIFDSDDVMVVEDVGPVCLNCLHDVASWTLAASGFLASAQAPEELTPFKGVGFKLPPGVQLEVPDGPYTAKYTINAVVLHELKSRVRKNVISMNGQRTCSGEVWAHDGSAHDGSGETFLFLQAGENKVAWFRVDEKAGGLVARVYSPSGPKDGTWDMGRLEPDYNGGQEFLCSSLDEWKQFHRGVYGALLEWKP